MGGGGGARYGGNVRVVRSRAHRPLPALASPPSPPAMTRAERACDCDSIRHPISLLRDRRQITANGGALHEALVLDRVVVGGAVQDGAVVPHDHVAFAPGMRQPVLRLIGALRELVEQRLAGRLGPAA